VDDDDAPVSPVGLPVDTNVPPTLMVEYGMFVIPLQMPLETSALTVNLYERE